MRLHAVFIHLQATLVERDWIDRSSVSEIPLEHRFHFGGEGAIDDHRRHFEIQPERAIVEVRRADVAWPPTRGCARLPRVSLMADSPWIARWTARVTSHDAVKA